MSARARIGWMSWPAACLAGVMAMGLLGGAGDDPAPKDEAKPAAPQTTPPAAAKPADDHHDELLPNLHLAFKDVYSGGLPAGEPAFDELKKMGIKTIINVDGAVPNLKAAESRDMRYVHIPLKYSGISPAQQAALSRAVRDLPKPIYIHCHHGKHRSPAAAAVAGIGVGAMTDEQGSAFLTTCGTGKNYAGLWSCVGKAPTLTKEELDAVPATFPAVCEVPTTTHLMIEIDDAFTRLKAANSLGYSITEIDGITSVSDAAQIADHLRAIWQVELHKNEQDRIGGTGPKSLGEWCRTAADEAQALEDALAIEDPAKRPSVESLKATFKVIADSCKSCHVEYRDNE